MNKEENLKFTNLKGVGQLHSENIVESSFDNSLSKSLGLSEKEMSDLQKADVVRAFDSYDSKMVIGKTGKEIKAGLTSKQATLNTKKQIVEDKKVFILSELKALGCQDIPDTIPYQAKEMDDETTRIFSWDVVNKYRPIINKVDSTELASGNTPTLEEKKIDSVSKKMEDYNNMVEICLGIYKDLYLIDTMIKNLKDGSTYHLNMKQLQASGL